MKGRALAPANPPFHSHVNFFHFGCADAVAASQPTRPRPIAPSKMTVGQFASAEACSRGLGQELVQCACEAADPSGIDNEQTGFGSSSGWQMWGCHQLKKSARRGARNLARSPTGALQAASVAARSEQFSVGRVERPRKCRCSAPSASSDFFFFLTNEVAFLTTSVGSSVPLAQLLPPRSSSGLPCVSAFEPCCLRMRMTGARSIHARPSVDTGDRDDFSECVRLFFLFGSPGSLLDRTSPRFRGVQFTVLSVLPSLSTNQSQSFFLFSFFFLFFSPSVDRWFQEIPRRRANLYTQSSSELAQLGDRFSILGFSFGHSASARSSLLQTSRSPSNLLILSPSPSS